MVRINNLTKIYSGNKKASENKKAVDNLSLSIEKGQIYGFIGPNGAGKTTTLKCLCGITDFDMGEIFVDDMSIKDNSLSIKNLIAYIPDNPDVYENLKGIQYLNFISDIFEIPKDVRKERIERYAKLFEMENDLGNQINSYSHGMRQKIVVISALIHEPKLMILDEPFVGLDPVSSHKLREVMRQICDNGGSVLFSTHVLETAEKICDKISIIQKGKIIAEGSVKELTGDSSLEDVFLGLVGQ